MRDPAAGIKYQNEPIQAPLNQVQQSSSFDDILAGKMQDGLEKQTIPTQDTLTNLLLLPARTHY